MTAFDNHKDTQKSLTLNGIINQIFSFFQSTKHKAVPCSCDCGGLSCTAILHNVFTIPPEGINQKLHDSLTNLQARQDHGGNERKRERTKGGKKTHPTIVRSISPYTRLSLLFTTNRYWHCAGTGYLWPPDSGDVCCRREETPALFISCWTWFFVVSFPRLHIGLYPSNNLFRFSKNNSWERSKQPLIPLPWNL